jgi:hypothetical protein
VPDPHAVIGTLVLALLHAITFGVLEDENEVPFNCPSVDVRGIR